MLLSLRQKDIGKAYVKRLAAQMASHSSSPNPPKRVRVDPVVAEDDDFQAYLANMAKVDDEVERQEDDVINTALLHFEAGNPPPEVIRRAIHVVSALPTTQASVERLFSALKLLSTDRRTRIQNDILNSILFLRCNKLVWDFPKIR